MENRFSFKDILVLALLGVLIVSVWLAMKQYDRQWEQLDKISKRVEDQGKDIISIERTLASGVPATSAASTQPMTSGGDPFARLKAAQKMPGFAAGGILVDAFANSVGKLTPLVSTDAYSGTVQGYVLESLCDRDPVTLEWEPLLCISWHMTDRTAEQDRVVETLKAAGRTAEQIAKDATVPPAIQISFKMRPGVTFSDGEPLTADDVIFSYQWIMNPKVNSPRDRAYLARITKLEKSAPDEVTFTFHEPYFQAFELAASFAVMPKHFYGKYDPEKFNESVGLLLGSGPYRLEDPTGWKPGTLIQLRRNDRYWGVTGAFDRLIWREISNDSARLAAFRNGDVDVFGSEISPVPPEQYAQMIKDASLQQHTQHFDYQTPIAGYRYVAWNEMRDGKPTIFADARVRRALTMLLDRKRLIDQVMLGYAVETTGPFNPLSKQYNPEVKPLPYDVNAAIALLREAGFEDRTGDGVISNAQGQRFQFKLTYPTGSTNYEAMVLFMKDAFARAGIVLVPDPLDWSVLVERLNKKNFDAVTLGWSAGLESDIFQMFDSSQTIAEGDNFMSYKSPRLDGVIGQARRTVDEAKRMPMWREAHKIIYEDQPYTFLFVRETLVFMDARIKNVQQLPIGLNSRMEWFVPKALQRTAN